MITKEELEMLLELEAERQIRQDEDDLPLPFTEPNAEVPNAEED